MDLFIQRDDENTIKILNVIKEFSGSSIGFTKEDFLKENNVLM